MLAWPMAKHEREDVVMEDIVLKTTRFRRFKFDYTRMPELTLEQIKRQEIKLISDIGRAESIRDYGGL